ncbi:MAG: SGNH/GDSL hydrolase family protein [Rickettsia endosymbiont of Culicoides impunctatus]|nr:MAG: SGNH/GDSL hydrolase family protein [Rickettsia endosymbiont of Culicoides impunctatus]
MKSINQFILLSLLLALLTSCSNTCKNCTPDLLFKQIGFSPQPYINTQYRAFYVLGDSLSDTGAIIGVFNNMLSFVKQEFDTLRWIDNIYFSPPFYNERSFSNGPMAVEYVAKGLGLPMTPGWSFNITPELKQWIAEQKAKESSILIEDILQGARTKNMAHVLATYDKIGNNYAVGNSMASVGKSLPYTLLFNQFQLKNQLNALIKHHPNIGADDLFIIIIGGNDIKAAVVDEAPTKIIDESINEIFNDINLLVTKKVKHIVVSNVPDIGTTPYFVDTNKQILATNLTQDFNLKLNNGIESLKTKHHGVNIKLLDIRNIFQNVLADYKQKGNNISQPCVWDIANKRNTMLLLELVLTGELRVTYNFPCSKYKICNYLFFDSFHPTVLLHKVVGDTLFDLIITNNDL